MRPSLRTLLVVASAALFGATAPGGVVEAQSTVPTVERIVFLGLATGDSTYFRGEAVRVRVVFTKHVVVSTTSGKPYVDLMVGTKVRRALFVTSRLNRLDFSYTVQSADYDADGVSVTANALKLNGATIKAKDNAALDANATHGAVAGGAARKVDGSRARAPKVRSVTFNSAPASGDTYGYGEEVVTRVAFDRPVLVSTTGGTPRLALTVGTQVRQATLSNSAGTHRRLSFVYAVQGDDSAPGGVSVAANALNLNGGTITAGADSTTAAVLAHGAIAADSTRKIDGRRGRPPRVDRIVFLGPEPEDSTYWRGDTIVVEVGFDAKVAVDTTNGKPQVALTVGTSPRQAVYSARGEEALRFLYVVQQTDADSDGVGIAANALALNGGRIMGTDVAASRAANLAHVAVDAKATRKVDGSKIRTPAVESVAFAGSPAEGDTYHYGNDVLVQVAFNRTVVVDTTGGKPQLELTIGTQRRRAVVVAPAGATAVLDFTYKVQSADLDADGASIAANALTLNGGTIKASADGTTAASLAHGALAATAARKVDGRPRIVAMELVHPPGRPLPPQGIYKFQETIWIRARFDQTLTMTGKPQVSLVVGTDTVQVNARWDLRQNNRAVEFPYRVPRGAKDANGVSVPKGSLDLNGATLKAASDNVTNARLDHVGVAADDDYKVDGNVTPVPRARIGWWNQPASGDTFTRGERIRIRAIFHTRVAVAGKPQLTLKVGTRTRQLTAVFATAWGPAFDYVVQADDQDADGISVPENALSLPGGAAIRAAADTSVAASLAHDSLPADASRKVAGNVAGTPKVQTITVSPLPSSDSTYTRGERFYVNVHFDRDVAVNTTDGKPRVALDIGGTTRYATYSHSFVLEPAKQVFEYVVQATDLDADGLSIPANALSANGASITLANDTVAADLAHGTIAVRPARKVDGSRTTPPRVQSVWLGLPVNGHTYVRGEPVSVVAAFDRQVAVDTAAGSPYFDIEIGSAKRRATYAGQSLDKMQMGFEYLVQAGDVDEDGVGVAANALSAGGSAITAPGDTTPAVLAHVAVPSVYSYKVDGRLSGAATVRAIAISDPTSDSTFTRHEDLYVNVYFDREVAVSTTDGVPRIALDVGGSTRYATYSNPYASTRAIHSFRYVVQASDVDADGISIAANALSANGGSITTLGDTVAADLSHEAVAADSARKANGGRTGTPRVRSLWFSVPPSGGAYVEGDSIHVVAAFDREVAVDVTGGRPYIEIDVGGTKRRAPYAARHLARSRITFRYLVQAADRDPDGVSVPANSLAANGGSITTPSGTTPAILAHDSLPANAAHKVTRAPPRALRVSIGPDPSSDSTYTLHEEFNVSMSFDRAVVVDTTGGRPRIALDIGGATRYATYSHPHNGGPTLQVFAYTVQASDRDTDGISIAANALSANGGSITAPGETAAADLSHAAVAADSARKVNGGRTGSPRPRWVWLASSPVRGDTYRQGEAIKVDFTFDRRAVVDTAAGVPYVEIDVGGTKRRASWTGPPSPSSHFRFTYVVQTADRDTDGASVPASTLTANGGSITGVPGAANTAILTHDSLPANAAHKVNGALPPRAVGVRIGPNPSSDSTYTLHEEFNVSVSFDRAVVVDTTGGRPRVALDIGGATRYATYSHPHNGGPTLQVFAYTVQASDRDTDGISIAANALSANGGSITAPGETAAADLSHAAVVPDAARKVNGGRTGGPRPRWVWLASTPASGDTYRQGEAIKVDFTFDRRAVVDTAAGVPYVEIDVGGTKRRASWTGPPSPSSHFRFAYVVQAADRDTDGVSVPANTLTGNGGSITGVPGAATAAVLTHDSLPANAAHKVNGATASSSANRKPEIVAPMTPKTLELASVPVAEELSAYFRDPDGDELTYTAVSSAQPVAAVTIAGNALTVRPRAVGQSLVTVRAADPKGAEAEQSFLVTVEASRSDRARILKRSLAAFGRTVGTEAVEAIGGRLAAGEEAGAPGQSHFRVGGQSLSCDAASRRHGCGLEGLARQASRLLGVRLSPGVSGLASALHGAANGRLDAEAARGLAHAFGKPVLGAEAEANAARHDEDIGKGRLLTLNPMSRRDFLSQASFRFSPGGGGQATGGGRRATPGDEPQPTPGGWMFWGQMNTGGFEGRPEAGLALDATVRSAYLGADYRFGPGPLAGLALSRTTSSISFESEINGNGTVDVSLTGLYPYVRWSPRSGLSVWGLLGAGWGDADMWEAATGQRFETNIGMFTTAAGARQEVVHALAFKADAFAVRTDAGDAGDLAGVAAHAYRLRLAPEIGGRWAASERASVRSRAELGVRIDGGDAETGIGAEAGAEVAFAHEGIGLHIDVRGRTLVAHQAEAFKEWGASVSVRLQPGRRASGLSVRIEPTWGNVASGMAMLWRDGMAGGAFGGSLDRSQARRAEDAVSPISAGRLEVETGYAFVVPELGRIAPFGRWALERESGYRINVGIRLSALDATDGPAAKFRASLDLFGEHTTRGVAPADRRLGLQGAIQFR